jgi:hypothetical protein
MRKGLEKGRAKGRVGWDNRWLRTMWNKEPLGPTGSLMLKLLEEVAELISAVSDSQGKTPDMRRIAQEAADVANLAMMVADVHGALHESVVPGANWDDTPKTKN